MRERERGFGQNDMRLTRIHFSIWEECLRREKACSSHGVLYRKSDPIFWYRSEKDCQKST